MKMDVFKNSQTTFLKHQKLNKLPQKVVLYERIPLRVPISLPCTKPWLFSGLQCPSLLCQVNCPLSLCFYLQRRCRLWLRLLFLPSWLKFPGIPAFAFSPCLKKRRKKTAEFLPAQPRTDLTDKWRLALFWCKARRGDSEDPPRPLTLLIKGLWIEASFSDPTTSIQPQLNRRSRSGMSHRRSAKLLGAATAVALNGKLLPSSHRSPTPPPPTP